VLNKRLDVNNVLLHPSGSRAVLVADRKDGGFALARFKLGNGRRDADADRVQDRHDKCPEEFGTRPNGCPKARR
jgi:hypothetical protein